MKPSLPRGTRDFGAAEMQKRIYLLNVLRSNFELFGFQPIETPAMEHLSTLTGKYGQEGDQLIYKILNSRLHDSKTKDLLRREFDLTLEGARNSEALTDKALRYDLTIPFARFVAMNQHSLVFPFKRYQIQPVWRADKPQKGRYREFYQCDADVIGSESLTNELEFIAMIDKIFSELGLHVILKFNNRKVLSGMARTLGEEANFTNITIAIDKLDKVGAAAVEEEMRQRGISEPAISAIQPLLHSAGSNEEKLAILKNLVKTDEEGLKGIEELEFLLAEAIVSHAKFELDISLARGLNYYTGTIFEVKPASGTLTSSILGGGRYDDLTGIFEMPGVSGTGISFGVDRIYDVMEELELFPEKVKRTTATRILFAHFDTITRGYCLRLAAGMRKQGVACEIYPDLGKKLGKQFEYADKKNIPFVCAVGSNEMRAEMFPVKNLRTGEQQQMTLRSLVEMLKKIES
jgi:histidyl-tRNA synthetase